MSSSQINYNPTFFDPTDEQDARSIILDYESMDLDNRWEQETAWLSDLFRSFRTFDADSIVADVGVGIGRVSKVLIDEYACKVTGVDINPKMLAYSTSYVNSDLYSIMLSKNFMSKRHKTKYTHLITAWAIQHVPFPESHKIIQKMHETLEPGGLLFVLEMNDKCVPCDPISDSGARFFQDQSNLPKYQELFEPVTIGKLPLSIFPTELVGRCWWGLLRKR